MNTLKRMATGAAPGNLRVFEMIQLSKISLEDYLGLIDQIHSKDSLEFDIPDRPLPNTEEIKKWWQSDVLAGRYLIWSVRDSSQTVCGLINAFDFNESGDCCEIGVTIFPRSNFNKGYGRQAIQLMIEQKLRPMQLRLIRAETNVHNTYAIRLFETLGFQFVKYQPDNGVTFYCMEMNLKKTELH